MGFLTCEDILKATGGTLLSGDINTAFKNICTDSRKIVEGDLFIPLVGEKYDGHDFIPDCLAKGAYGTITQNDLTQYEYNRVIIKVNNTLKALGGIAAYYRSKFCIPVVAVTGSVGKTSTKDMIASVLSKAYKVLKTEANYNNEIGLPTTLLKLDETYEAAVLEMGMRGFGEISYLTRIAKPDVAVVTNIGMAHIERLGSRENIRKAKMEIVEGLSSNGLLILNGDDDLLYELKDSLSFRTIYYGLCKKADIRAENIKKLGIDGTRFDLVAQNGRFTIEVPVPGMHNVYNALAAFAAGLELNVPADLIAGGIKEYSPGRMRLDIIDINGTRVINDAYNASPQSVQAAIEVLMDIGGSGRTFAVLGDMLEMGEWSYKAHKDIGKFAFSKGVEYIITVGRNGKHIASGAIEAGAPPSRVFSFDNNADAAAFIKSGIGKGDTVLVKGSRGMKMEEIVEILQQIK